VNYFRPIIKGDLASNFDNNVLKIDIDGDVNLKRSGLEMLPMNFGRVRGDFWVDDNQLITLLGSPRYVFGDFSCESNGLVTLKHGPAEVEGDYFCSANHLTSLSHLPSVIGGGLFCSNNQITSLVGIPKRLKYLYCDFNSISSLFGIAFVLRECEVIDLSGCPITKGGLGLLQIQGLKELHANGYGKFAQAAEIISAFIGKGQIGIYTCSHELRKANLHMFADT
jgi:Leucine-rich repeat (LRR) protein